jgi:hypothetical protein
MKTIGTGALAGKVCALCALASLVMDRRSAASLGTRATLSQPAAYLAHG